MRKKILMGAREIYKNVTNCHENPIDKRVKGEYPVDKWFSTLAMRVLI